MKLKVTLSKSRRGVIVRIEVAEKHGIYSAGEVLLKGLLPNIATAHKVVEATVGSYTPCTVEYTNHAIFE